MSNYPPTPSFGGAFNFSGHRSTPQASHPQAIPPPPASDSQVPRSQQEQEQHQQQDQQQQKQNLIAPAFPPLHPQDLQALYNANSSNFAANSQTASWRDGNAVNGPPAPSFSYHPFSASSLPPPPFPPVPIPPLPENFRLLQPTAQAVPTTNAPSVDPRNLLPQSHTNTESTEGEFIGEQSAGENGDREEGELSEGEDTEAKKDDSPASGGLSTATMGSAFSKTRTDENAQPIQPQHSEQAGTSYDPPSSLSHKQVGHYMNGAKSSSPGNIQPETVYASGSLNSNRPQHSQIVRQNQHQSIDAPTEDLMEDVSQNGTFQQPILSADASQLRKQATGALINLFPHNVRYEELVREGVDPLILRQLYDEIGVKVATSFPPPAVDARQSTPAHLAVPEIPSSISASQGSSESSDLARPSELNQATSAPSVPSLSSTIDSSLTSASKRPDLPDSLPSSHHSDLSGGLKSLENKPPDRSQYIARMLAAKTGKPLASANQSETTTLLQKTDSAPVPSTPPRQNQVSAPRVEEMDRQNGSPDPHGREKSKAQTELARQKMEQLRQQMLLSKSAIQNPSPARQNTIASNRSTPLSIQDPEAAIAVGSRTAGTSSLLPSDSTDLAPNVSVASDVPSSRIAGLRQPTSLQIPGLFMTAPQQHSPVMLPASTSPSVESLGRPSSQPVPIRNRSLAADLGDELSTASRHLFDQGESERVVIDISEDEMSCEEHSDVEHDQSTNDRGLDPSSGAWRSYNSMPRDSFGKGAASSLNHMTPITGSTPQTPGKGKDNDNLRRKDQEIEEMKQRIKEMEARRKTKASSSRTETPVAAGPPGSPGTGPASAVPGDISMQSDSLNGEHQVSAEMELCPSSTPERPNAGQVSSPISNVSDTNDSPPHILPATRVIPASPQEIETKRKRKAELESGLPILDAEVERTRSRLEQMRRDMLRLEDEIRRGLEGRQLLVDELNALGVETDGIPTEDLQAKMDEVLGAKLDAVIEANDHGSPTDVPVQTSPGVVDVTNPKVSGLIPADVRAPESAIAETSHIATPLKDVTLDVAATTSSAKQREVIPILSSEESEVEEGQPRSAGMSSDEREQQQHVDQDLDDDDSAMSIESGLEDTDSDINGKQKSSIARDELVPMVTAGDGMSPNQSRNGSVAEVQIQDAPDSGTERNDSGTPGKLDEDGYEPPDVVDPSLDDTEEQVDSPPFSPAPPDASAFDPVFEPASAPYIGGDGVPETLPSALPPQVRIVSNRFSPYESPLKQFHSYRFHPDFTSNVQGGFKSLTYSNKIDPQNPICAYESSGGVCKDPGCASQHFRDMRLSDDQILVELGKVREGVTELERQQYVDGIRKIIANMRRDKVNDLNTIAGEIASYRRRYLQDKSRFLTL